MFPVEALPSFLAFAEHLNFTTAARELHISQPALHVKVRKLAEAVGRPLYLRDGRRLVLTADGEALARFARDREDQLDDFLQHLAGEAQQRPVVLAAGQGAYLYLLGDVIAREATRLRLITSSRAQTLALVRDGRAHLGVAVLDAVPDDLDTVLLAKYPQKLVLPPGHPLAQREVVHVADLAGMRMVVPPAPRPLRMMLERAAAGATWEVAVEAEGWPLMLHFVQLGVGAAVVNGCVRTGLPNLPIVDLPAVPYYAVHRRGALSDSRIRRMLDEIRQSLGST
ncbi:LysR family transcriptional regulator [Actinocrispum sp. NPDC049592]|uniref:LysR family transcriptional regulator n=1 Tax=Actinocrispum sp. NPDC049592 TaxID=3154835 RepID=UPI00341F53C9